MTQPDEWKSPYDPPQQNTPGPVPDPAPAPGQAGVPSPYQQDPQQPYQQQPYQQPYEQPYQQDPGNQLGQYQAQPPQYGTPYEYTAPPEKNALGVWSLVLGILSVVMLFSCLVGFLAAIPALITGYLSRKAQREGLANNGGLALGGIITGWVTIGLTILAAVGIGVLFTIPEFREGFFSDTSYDY
ncbi:DUF4190 domain-containing protein [Promicromonospora sp. NPDC057138]|uniref:DUF4190 domain-containing protein n=1 Tax=Promicromonospora sp. NPDC057138 TaxID=3346031 RepID=UPI0036424F12